jgi:hypothetical protein
MAFKNISLELPQGPPFTAEQTRLLNEKLRTIQEKLGVAIEAEGDFDLKGKKLLNVGNGTAATDGLNLRVADRRFFTVSPSSGNTTPTSGGPAQPTSTGNPDTFLFLSVSGFLTIQASAAVPAMLFSGAKVAEIVALVGDAPVGDSIDLLLRVDGREFTTLSIAAGQKRGRKSGTGLASIPAGQVVSLDIVGVPPSGAGSPGRDLSVLIRLA